MGSARRCLTCKVLFKSIDALSEHCALSAHPLSLYRCQSCDKAFTSPSGLQSHLGSARHERQSRIGISAQRTQASHDSAIQQPVLDATPTINNVEDLTLAVCSRCKLTFENHLLLFEHYRTSSMHQVCPICFQVFPKRKSLKKHMTECHPPVPVFKSEDRKMQISVPAPPADPPAVLSTKPTPQPELLEDDDFVLVEKLPLLLRTPETPTPATSISQAENAKHAIPISSFKCPGCQIHFHPFSTFVIHIERGACSSASKSRQINNEMNTLAAQLFRNMSVIPG